MLRHIVNEVDRENASRLNCEIEKLYGVMSAASADRNQAAAQARTTAEVAGRIAQQVSMASFDPARTRRLLQAIARDGDTISRQGERAAEQAAMALQSLYLAYPAQAGSGNDVQIRAALKNLFQLVENPSAYNAPQFAEAMRALSQVLP